MTNKTETILITGCSSGIGYVTAKFLQQQGCRVIASARKNADVKRLTDEGFETVQLDLADSLSIQQAIASVIELTEGKLGVLFNNAAFGQPGAIEDLSRDNLRHQFETNLFGTHELTNLVIPLMRKQGYGKIIYNSSILGIVAMKYRGAYNASKFALEGLADTLRLELRDSNIHVSLIEPGPIRSDFRKNAFALYQKNINPNNSFHQQNYLIMQSRLEKQGDAQAFTLPAQAVADTVLKILNNRHPNSRYYVTFPAYLFAFLKRLLPTSWLDFLLTKIN